MSSLIDRRQFLALAVLALPLAACTGTMPAVLPAGDGRPESLTPEQIAAAVNAVRKANGAPAWTYNPRLESAARSQARLMASRDTLSHDLGTTLRQRVTAAGYLGAVGENVAKGYASLDAALGGWMASSGHRSTLLSPRFTEFGLAMARTANGRLYWAMVAGGSFDAWRV